MKTILWMGFAALLFVSSSAVAYWGSACGENEVPIRKCYYDERGKLVCRVICVPKGDGR